MSAEPAAPGAGGQQAGARWHADHRRAVMFLQQKMAEREKRLLLDVGAAVY
jgi:hypothetical protein